MDEFYPFSVSILQDPHFFSTQVTRGDYLIADRRSETSAALQVMCGGWEACAADYRIERETFRYFALEFIAGGEWEIEFSEGKQQIGVGAIFAYGPGIPYRLRALGGSGLSKYFVDFRGSEALRCLAGLGLAKGGVAAVRSHRWLRELFDQLVEAKEFGKEDQFRVADKTLDLILTRLPLHLTEGISLAQSWKTFERCRDYITEHYLALTGLADVARNCNVSGAYLSRLFRKHSNETPKAFLDRLKMSYAAQKLLRGELQVKQVAVESGYQDVFHFSRVFKKTFGMPPSVFANRQASSA